jgi:hypothetical protein
MKELKGFLFTLFDISFNEFITAKIIRFLYALSIVGLGIGAVFCIGLAFRSSEWLWLGPLTLFILAPALFLICLTCVRILLELIIVIFIISENTARIANNTEPRE